MTIAATAFALLACVATPAHSRGSGVMFANVGFAKLLEDGAPSGSVGLGIGVTYQPAASSFGYGAEISYLNLGTVNQTVRFTAGEAYAEVSVRVVPVTAQISYRLPRSRTLQPYVNAGAGIYATTTKQSAQALNPDDSTFGTRQDTVTDAGMNVGGGVAFGRRETGLTIGFDSKLHVIFSDGGSSTIVTFGARIFFD